jgi:hypothetical protein
MNMNIVITAAVIVLLIVIAAIIFFIRKPRKIKTKSYQERWVTLQKLCADKATWAQAVTDADGLLNEALKRKRYPGKTMGERLTKAQRDITDNEGVWYGHKLRTKLEADPDTKLKESDVKDALLGIRQALKDLGALPDGK